MRALAMQNAQVVGKDGEQAMPVLDRQPPLPETTPLRLLGQDEDPSQERSLVPVTTYEEEGSYSHMEEGHEWNRNPPNSYQEG